MTDSLWINDFLRHSVYTESERGQITVWSKSLIDALLEQHPDQEVHVLGVSRIPKMPNYLISSSSENLKTDEPVRIHMTEKTADLFLAPVECGVRMLKEEFPMTVYYDIGGDMSRRLELNFYEAISFDGDDSSLILALVLNEGSMQDFLPPEEVASLNPLIRSQGIPLFELHVYRAAHSLLEEEAKLMTGVMRDSNPELLRILPNQRGDTEIYTDPALDTSFLQYAAIQLRMSLKDLMANIPGEERKVTRTNSGQLSISTQKDQSWHETLIKSFSNIATLLNPQVKPRIAAIKVTDLLRGLSTIAHRSAATYHVDLEVDEPPGDAVISGDQAAILRLCERLFDFTFPLCKEGKCWIRAVERTSQNYFVIEIEDSGPIPTIPAPTMLLRNLNQYAQDHPRLKNGGGIIFKLLSVFCERCEGRSNLTLGMHDGFAVQLVFPLLTSATSRPQVPLEIEPEKLRPSSRTGIRRGSFLDSQVIEVEGRKHD